jgi:hypothetical protein
MGDYLRQLWVWAAVIIISATVSIRLIAGLWMTHPRDPFVRKLLWSSVLLVPLFGWLFYGAFYAPLPENDVRAPVNYDAWAGH